MNIQLTFMESLIGGLAAGLLACMAAIVRMIFVTFRRIEVLVEDGQEQKESLKMIARIQHPQLEAHKATLEALKGNCNGNVDAAHERIINATAEYNDFLAARV